MLGAEINKMSELWEIIHFNRLTCYFYITLQEFFCFKHTAIDTEWNKLFQGFLTFLDNKHNLKPFIPNTLQDGGGLALEVQKDVSFKKLVLTVKAYQVSSCYTINKRKKTLEKPD